MDNAPLDVSVSFTPDRADAAAGVRAYLRNRGIGPVQDGLCFAIGFAALAAAAAVPAAAASRLAALGALGLAVGALSWGQRFAWVRNYVASMEARGIFAAPVSFRFTDAGIELESARFRGSQPWFAMGTSYLLVPGRRIVFFHGKSYGGNWPAAVLDAVGGERLVAKLEEAGLRPARRRVAWIRVLTVFLLLAAVAWALLPAAGLLSA